MLSLHCFRGDCGLCELWPLCDCDCHPEKKLEARILRGELDAQQVYDRMVHRLYYHRPEVRGAHNEQRTHSSPKHRYCERPRARCHYPGCTATYLVRPDRPQTGMCKQHACFVRKHHKRQRRAA